jgi:hypothetical protein
MSIQKIGDIYRVCVAGMCKDHQQEWQAKVFYHQMLVNNPNVHAGDLCECRGAQSP